MVLFVHQENVSADSLKEKKHYKGCSCDVIKGQLYLVVILVSEVMHDAAFEFSFKATI